MTGRQPVSAYIDKTGQSMTPGDDSLLEEAAQATADAEAANVPGVYVYNFPAVLADELNGLVRRKVGRAGGGATDRVFGQQSAVTGWPEPPLLLRVYSHESLTPLTAYATSKSVVDETAHLFLADGLTLSTADADATEHMVVRAVPFTDTVAMVLWAASSTR